MLNYTHIQGQFKINQKDINLTTIIPWAVRLSWLENTYSCLMFSADDFDRTSNECESQTSVEKDRS